MTLLTDVLQHPRTQQSLATIARHAASPRGLCETSALRLLRRNARDARPGLPVALQWSVAREVLNHWKNGA